MSWTEERVERLKELWNNGLSASQIAADLGGVTQNAVIGKVHRIGLAGRAKAPATMRTKRKVKKPSQPRQTSNVAKKVSKLTTTKDSGAPTPLKLALIELNDIHCKWPIGDPEHDDFHFCAHKRVEESPYCAYHSNIAYQPVAGARRGRGALSDGVGSRYEPGRGF